MPRYKKRQLMTPQATVLIASAEMCLAILDLSVIYLDFAGCGEGPAPPSTWENPDEPSRRIPGVGPVLIPVGSDRSDLPTPLGRSKRSQGHKFVHGFQRHLGRFHCGFSQLWGVDGWSSGVWKCLEMSGNCEDANTHSRPICTSLCSRQPSAPQKWHRTG
jgi:hypothetical protein